MNRLVLFMLLFLFWTMLTWTTDWPGPAYLQDIGVGLVVAGLVTWTMGEASLDRSSRWLEPARYGWGFVYLFVLAAYIVKANVEVAYRVLHPAMPIHPGIVRVKTKLRRPASRTVLGNSVTLCPGTLTVDIWKDGTMMMHWIDVRPDKEAAQQIVNRFEWFVDKILE